MITLLGCIQVLRRFKSIADGSVPPVVDHILI